MSQLSDALESMHTVMALDSRDWAANKRDAWLYGIVIGWGSSVREFEEQGWWTAKDTVRLRAMHRAVQRAKRRPEGRDK